MRQADATTLPSPIAPPPAPVDADGKSEKKVHEESGLYEACCMLLTLLCCRVSSAAVCFHNWFSAIAPPSSLVLQVLTVTMRERALHTSPQMVWAFCQRKNCSTIVGTRPSERHGTSRTSLTIALTPSRPSSITQRRTTCQSLCHLLTVLQLALMTSLIATDGRAKYFSVQCVKVSSYAHFERCVVTWRKSTGWLSCRCSQFERGQTQCRALSPAACLQPKSVIRHTSPFSTCK